MPKPKDAAAASAKSSKDQLWIPRILCALLLKQSPSVFDFSIKPRIGGKDVKSENNATYYYAPAVVTAYNEWKEEKSGSKKNSDAEDDATRRIKIAKAEREELETLEAKKRVVSVEDWEDRTSELWTAIDNLGKKMKRHFGNEGVLQFNDFLDEVQRVLNDEKALT
jgi:hypothetical protein